MHLPLFIVENSMEYRQNVFITTHSLRPLVQNILLHYLPNLRTLDLGFDSSHFIMDWDTTPVRAPLTYLRVTLHCIEDLLAIMATRSLSTTLRHLHVKLRDSSWDIRLRGSEMKIAFRMSSLCTFTFVKALHWQFSDEWSFIDVLTSFTVMPVLQRAKLIVAIDESDLNWIDRSALFNDNRRVDVQFAFILNDDRSYPDLDRRIPRGSRSHPRWVVSTTFVKSTSNDDPSYPVSEKALVSFSPTFLSQASRKWHHWFFQGYGNDLAHRSYLWYSLPWAFNELVQLSIPDGNISQLDVLQPPCSSAILSSSRLVRMDSIYNGVSPILTRSPILCPGENRRIASILVWSKHQSEITITTSSKCDQKSRCITPLFVDFN